MAATKKLKDKLKAVPVSSVLKAGECILLKNESGALSSLSHGLLFDNVFIMYHAVEAYLSRPHQWPDMEAAGYQADGVVIVEGGRMLVVAPTESDDLLPWGPDGVAYGTCLNFKEAFEDWSGVRRTQAIIDAFPSAASTSCAVGFCKNYSRIGGKYNQGIPAGDWWLPSFGELAMIVANMNKINYALSFISGAQLLSEYDCYWSSSELNKVAAFQLRPYDWMCWYSLRSEHCLVRPVSSFDVHS